MKLEKVFLSLLSIEKGELITIHSSSPRQNISLILGRVDLDNTTGGRMFCFSG